MKSHLFIALAAMNLILTGPTAHTQVSSSNPGCLCPQTSSGWVLYEDSNRGVPDFWWQDSLKVQEISICEHGVSFVFLADERGSLQMASLVIVNPTEQLIKTRLGLRTCDPRFVEELDHFRMRYLTLRHELSRLWGAQLEPTAKLVFSHSGGDEDPWIINPAYRLILNWRGEQIELRGYLDVYFTAIT